MRFHLAHPSVHGVIGLRPTPAGPPAERTFVLWHRRTTFAGFVPPVRDPGATGGATMAAGAGLERGFDEYVARSGKLGVGRSSLHLADRGRT
jgi:hypothetical protein